MRTIVINDRGGLTAVFGGGSPEVTIVRPGTESRLVFKGDPTTYIKGRDALSYLHTQSVPAVEWQINHNLGVKPSIDVFSPGGVKVDPLVLNGENLTLVRFSFPFAGYARLIA